MAILTPLTRRQELYSDFYKDFTLIPGRDDLARKVNEDAVKEAIRNIILTDKGERLFQPNIGSTVKGMLFENITPDVVVLLQERIKDALALFEPRANILEVKATSSIDSNSVEVSITFNVINRETPVTFNVILDRAR
jgi:phage baseplate assembly protein W